MVMAELLNWLALIDGVHPDFNRGVFADWLEDNNQPLLARGFRLITTEEPDHSEESRKWFGYDPSGAQFEDLPPHSFDWWCRGRGDTNAQLPVEVFSILTGGILSDHLPQIDPFYREYPSRHAAFFALAEALVQVEDNR